MLTSYQLFANNDLYEYGKMEAICAYMDGSVFHFDAYVDKYKGKIRNKTCSEVHVMILFLDPINGITEIVRNDYYKNPLKQKIEINAVAKRAVVSNAALSSDFHDSDEIEDDAEEAE